MIEIEMYSICMRKERTTKTTNVIPNEQTKLNKKYLIKIAPCLERETSLCNVNPHALADCPQQQHDNEIFSLLETMKS